MTNQETIKAIEIIKSNCRPEKDIMLIEALELAIEILNLINNAEEYYNEVISGISCNLKEGVSK